MDASTMNDIAERLERAERDRIAIDPPAASRAITAEDAYRIQLINVERRLANGRRIIGRKIGLTSIAMQKMLGVNEPDFGHLFDDMMLMSGGECRVDMLLAPWVEPEIAFVLARELRGPGITRQDVLSAADYVTPALEIIDSRIRDWKITLADTIADNASSARVVLGEHKTKPAMLDLAVVAMTLRKNGATVERGLGSAVLGHPAEPVAWLANKLAEFGQALAAGSVIIPGALSRAVPVEAGDLVVASFQGLGSVSVSFV
jgi:2-keto-4-pentenoate hydratase